MLSRGFSLLEMLLTLVLTSLIMTSIVTFYPKFHAQIIQINQQNRLEKATHQALSGLIKDIKRAGFIANSPHVVTKPAIEINSSGNCIILRYDTTSRGEWRDNQHVSQLSDVFAYRFTKNSLDSQTGINHCGSSATRWEKLFDPDEITVIHFKAKQFTHYTELHIIVALKRFTTIRYQITYYVKNENQ